MATLEETRRALLGAQAVIDGIQASDFVKPTPCTEWDVKMLINHMCDALAFLAAPARGEQPQVNMGPPPDAVGTDASAAFAATTRELLDAWGAPGAETTTFTTMFGEQPGTFYLTLAVADTIVHAWDLSKATGVPYAMDANLAQLTLTAMQGMLSPEMRGGAFGPEVPCDPSASVQERLIAFSGRQG